jgi:hypothetical protein
MKTLSALDPFLMARRRCLAILAVLLLIPVLPSHSSDRDREDRLVEEMEANRLSRRGDFTDARWRCSRSHRDGITDGYHPGRCHPVAWPGTSC